ncbi:MAG TPA: methyltransferase domain-containing protein [Candidatus Dormibacteraeota bacterium]|nr:methyltransferase domain-containing protein [Candidatus Dormibacteraeota bacterium]
MERYVIRGGREGYDRLKILARTRWPDTSAFLERIGLRGGMRCVDLGCGGGDVTLEIARIVGPDGSVVGVDMDEVKLDLARSAAAEKGLSNVEFHAGNVNDWTAPSGYDLVYSRFLLQHLSRPGDLLRRMWYGVCSEGVLAVEDVDFDGLFCEPPNAAFDFFASTFPRTIARYGGDGSIGRKLHRLFLEVGIPDPQVKLVQWAESSGDGKRLPLLTLEATAKSMVEGGLATQQEIDAAAADLAEFTNDPATIVGSPRIFQVWASRA